MPYIKQEQRELLEATLEELAQTIMADGFQHYETKDLSGRLNYVFTELLARTLLATNVNYDKLNSAIGLLESCKLELYRRQVANYEQSKIDENGDIDNYSAFLKMG